MATFGERLKQLRIARNITQREMAQYLGIATNAYQNYEYDNRDMNIKSLRILADYFNVPIDYLTGRTDEPNVISVTSQSRNLLSDNRLSLDAKGLYMQLQYLAIDNKARLPDEEKFLTENKITKEDFDGVIKELVNLGYVKIESEAEEIDGTNPENVYVLV